MTFTDSNNEPEISGASDSPAQPQPIITASETAPTVAGSAETVTARRRILIGSQRDPAAYRPRPKRDWTPIDQTDRPKPKRVKRKSTTKERKQEDQGLDALASRKQSASRNDVADSLSATLTAPLPLPDDVETEMERALSGATMDELLAADAAPEDEIFEPNSIQTGRVVAVRRDDVFVEFAGRRQGVAPLRQFAIPPVPGSSIQVLVQRLNPEDGLYELSLPNNTVQVDDWSDLAEGALVDVRVTGYNAGGLECEVGHIRGFIPASQISLYRVEDLGQYVDQKFVCVITESNPERRKLVLSRRVVLEREKEQARHQMLASLQPGQVLDGVVRKLMDFGAFVDLGNGVDGLLHVSQVAWGRVNHPSDVLKEGQPLKVRIEKVDPATGKISLAYRDLLENPWTEAARKYPPQSVVTGTITKLMDFGAFVELEPGIEGLVHVSELSHRRIRRPAEVVKPGDQVQVMVLSVDPNGQRMSLSMKALAAAPEPETPQPSDTGKTSAKRRAKPVQLKGGLDCSTGDRYGLRW